LPLLLQHARGSPHHGPLCGGYVLDRLRELVESFEAEAAKDSSPRLRLTPHDLRHLFATNAVQDGLPVHVLKEVLGHRDLSTTQQYVAVYPEHVIDAFHAHLAARRLLRPTDEYATPTAGELERFFEHFPRRRLALGDCVRPYESPCRHEHACVRCPMLVPDPERLSLLLEKEASIREELAFARQHDLRGEVEGLEITLVHYAEKRREIDRRLEALAG
jgi:integrase-like protein